MSVNNTHTVCYKVDASTDDDEMELLLNVSNRTSQIIGNNQITTINIDNDMAPGTSQQHLQRQHYLQQMRRDVDSTRIDMETNDVVNIQTTNGSVMPNTDNRQRMPNLFAVLREARHQLNRSHSRRGPYTSSNGENISANSHSRTWRENLYQVLSSPVSPRAHANVLRAIFTSSPSENSRYDFLRSNVLFPDDQIHFMLNNQNINQPEEEIQSSLSNQNSNGLEAPSSSALRLSRQNSRLTDSRILNEYSLSENDAPVVDSSIDNTGVTNDNSRRQSDTASSGTNGGRPPQRTTSIGDSTTPTIDLTDDADTNAVGEIIVKLVTHFIRYLPFIFIIFVKFIHDHLLGILDILVLHGVVYQINKSLINQVAKLNQKSICILVRDLILVVCVVTYRFILCTSTPDPFGLLINPPEPTIMLDFSPTQKTELTKDFYLDVLVKPLVNSEHQIYEVPSSPETNSSNSIISVTKSMSLGTLLYYVAVNDLILKLLTQLIKIIVTLFPTKIIRHKSRSRLYALIEHISQFYRALVPIRQWLRFLFGSYSGLEVISGLLFSSFYIGAKLYELFERGRPLKKSVINFLRNLDNERKPTKDELEAAGTTCPICHDSYSSPVVLECGHIFCDECVNTWFKREQTCPMCRAKVSENPLWQDGATTYFYQLC